MRYSIPKTLDYYLSAPYFRKVDLRGLQLAPFLSQMRSNVVVHSSVDKVSPDTEAIEFYCMNHLAAMIRRKFTPYEELPDWANKVMQQYLSMVVRQHRRLLYYTAIICTREARHGSSVSGDGIFVAQKANDDYKALYEKIHDEGSLEAAEIFLNFKPTGSAVSYYSTIDTLFNEGHWSGGSFGGKPWGTVTTNLLRFLRGEISSEAMIDTAYTLAHNNGPIFNKGMLYSKYGNKFLTILDVQRAGQMPELVAEYADKGFSLAKMAPWLVECVQLVAGAMGEIYSKVDWQKVQDAGALSDLSAFIDYNPATAPAKVLGSYKVTPNQAVAIIEHVREKPKGAIELLKGISPMAEALEEMNIQATITNAAMKGFSDALDAKMSDPLLGGIVTGYDFGKGDEQTGVVTAVLDSVPIGMGDLFKDGGSITGKMVSHEMNYSSIEKKVLAGMGDNFAMSPSQVLTAMKVSSKPQKIKKSVVNSSIQAAYADQVAKDILYGASSTAGTEGASTYPAGAFEVTGVNAEVGEIVKVSGTVNGYDGPHQVIGKTATGILLMGNNPDGLLPIGNIKNMIVKDIKA